MSARVVAAALLLCGGVGATLIPRLSFENLTDSSEVIVSGRISRVWTAWDSEHKYIWTHYELSTAAAYKGAAGSTVEFAEPGGSVDGRVMVIQGAVAYAPGDQVVVFLSRMPNRYLRTTGWAQGKYEVDATGRLHAAAAISEGDYVQGGKTALSGSTLRTLDGVSLVDLRQRITARLRSAGQGRVQ
ncbi:MAG: hypothetical protein QOJ99_2971 [Bryobacterales bacterium]|nr:hypothetical protein [Bryobacterales bacterium]